MRGMRLVLQVIAHEAAGDAAGRVREADLAAGAHVPEGAVVRTVHRRDARHERGRLERVAHGPPGGHAHHGVAPAHLLDAEALHRGA